MSGSVGGVNLLGEDSLEESLTPGRCKGAARYDEARKNGLMCDVFFEVGQEKRRFRAHRTILAIFSTVFRTCFFGSVTSADGSNEGNPTFVPDVNADAFELMLTFIYSGEDIDTIKITDQVAVHLLYAAEKYDIQSLKRACARHIEKICFESTGCILRQALEYNDHHIAKRCYDTICSKPDQFLESPDFFTSDSQALEMIIGRDDFVPSSEFSLLEHLLKWAEMKCEEEEIEKTKSGKRAALGSLLCLVRFPLMNADELRKVVRFNILTETEVGELFTRMATKSAVCGNFVTRKRFTPAEHVHFGDEICSRFRRFSLSAKETYFWLDLTGAILRAHLMTRYLNAGIKFFLNFCFSVNKQINIIAIGVGDAYNNLIFVQLANISYKVLVQPDCDSDPDAEAGLCFYTHNQWEPESNARVLSFIYPQCIPHKRYWMRVLIAGCKGIRKNGSSGNKTESESTTVLIRNQNDSGSEAVKFTFSSDDITKSYGVFKVHNEFLAEIYFTAVE